MSSVLAFATEPASVLRLNFRRRFRLGLITGWLLPVAMLAAWQLGASTGFIASTILPNPVEVARTGYRLVISGELLSNMEVSALRALAGLAVGGSVGLFFGFSNGLSRFSDALPIRRCRWRATSRISR